MVAALYAYNPSLFRFSRCRTFVFQALLFLSTNCFADFNVFK